MKEKRGNDKNFRYRMHSIVLACIMIAIAIVVNLIITQVVKTYPLKIDATRNKLYELTDDSKRIVSTLPKEVNIYLIESENNPMSSEVVEVIDRYRKASNGKITVESVDTVKTPTFGSRFGQGVSLTYGSIVFECGEKYDVQQSGSLVTVDSNNRVEGFYAENIITNSILYVTSDDVPVVYNITGHGEKEYGMVTSMIRQAHYEVEDLQLLTSDIPEDADMLLVFSPQNDFSAEEIEKLDAYLEKGGNVQFYFDVGVGSIDRLLTYLEEWGIGVNNDYVIEQDKQHIYGSSASAAINLIPQVQPYAFTEGITANSLMIAPFSRTLNINDKNVNQAVVVPILTTSEKALSRTDLQSDSFSKQENDVEGQHVISAMAIQEKDNTQTNVLVTGTTQLFLNSLLQDNASYANSDFVLNAVAWMSGDTQSVKIRAKNLVSDTLTLSVGTGITYTVIIFVLSLVGLIIGLWVWIRRRYL